MTHTSQSKKQDDSFPDLRRPRQPNYSDSSRRRHHFVIPRARADCECDDYWPEMDTSALFVRDNVARINVMSERSDRSDVLSGK